MDKKKNYQKKVVKTTKKSCTVSNTKKTSEQREVAKNDIDFNTNIFKQFCDKKDDKIISNNLVTIPNSSESATEFPQIEKKSSFNKEVDSIQNIQNLIDEYNSSIELKHNDENNSLNNNINIQNNTVTQNSEVSNYNKENIEKNYIKDNEKQQKLSIASNLYGRQLSYEESQEMNEKIQLRKKQEEYRKMLDEQNELNRRYKEKANKEKDILLKKSTSSTKSTPFNPPKQSVSSSVPNNSGQIQPQSIDVNHMKKYQEILNEFCDIKNKVFNEVNSLKQQQTIQKYQNILNSFIDSKISKVNEEMKQRLINEEAHKIDDNINYNNFNGNNQEIEMDNNVEEVTTIKKTEEVKREPIIIKQKNTNSKIKEYINRDKDKIKEKKVKPKTANAVQKIVIKPEKRKIKTSNEKKRATKVQKEWNIKEGKDNSSNWDFINSKNKKKNNKSEIVVKPISQPKISIALKDSLDLKPKISSEDVAGTNNNQEEVIDKLENIQKYVMNLLSNYKEEQ